eukprot:scpid92966/ scgid11227/ 
MDRSRIVNGIENGEHFGEIQLSWRPTLEQYGPRLFCFQATDHNGETTELRCVTLMAGASSPEIVPGTTQPSIATSATVPHYYPSFSVDFNQQVVISSSQAIIRILEVAGNGSSTTERFSVVPSTRDVIVERHPTHDSHYRLTFFIPERLKMGQRYAITLDPGVVIGTRSCVDGGAPSQGLTDTSSWQFVTDNTGTSCDDSPIGRKKAVIHTEGNTAADIVIVADESSNMERSHQWLSGMVPQLERYLQYAGIGVNSTLRNHYALVGYGRAVLPNGDDRYVLPRAFANSAGAKVFTIDSFSHVINQLSANGSIEDGYLAVKYALQNLTNSNGDNMLRLKHPNVATNVILVTDEDRDVYGPGKALTRTVFKRLIRRSGALLNVIVDQRFRAHGIRRNAMGMASNKVAYLDQAIFGTYMTRLRGYIGMESYQHTKRHYTTVALNLAGTAWDITALQAAGSLATSFTRAFLSVTTSEIADQIQKCRYCLCLAERRTPRWSCTIARNQAACQANATEP